MADILGMALKVTGDASGLAQSLTPASRALDRLAKQAERATSAFKPLADASEGASKAQELFARKFAALSQQLRNDSIGPEQYAASFAKLTDEAKRSVAAFERGIEITRQYTDEEEDRAQQLREISDLLAIGAIREETAARARAELTGANRAAAEADRKLATDKQSASRIIEANLTALERAQKAYDAAVAEAQRLERQGLLTKKELRAEIERQAQVLAKVAVEASKTADAVGRPALKFNELSGALAAIPGPLGNFSGRLSGLASATEGLTRVFAVGLTPGLKAVGATFASLSNPVTIGIAAVAGFGLAASRIARGLGELEGRLEALGNTALRLGTDFQTVQVLAEASQRTGQNIESVAAGLQRFNINVAEARKGSGQAAEAFTQLGISQQRLQTADTPGLAKEVADALQRIEEPAKRAAIAVDILGANGLALLPVFNSLEESQLALERFAAGISTIDQQRVSSLGTAFDNVKTSLAGLGQAALLPFAGVAEGFSNLVANSIGAVTRFAQIIGKVLTPVLDNFGKGLSLVGDGLFAVSNLFDGLLGNTQNAKASVDELRQSVEEPLDAGFAKEFEQTLRRITDGVSEAINESAKFGQAGFDAALRYQTSIDDLRSKLDAGFFNEETFRREAVKAGQAFKQELAKIEDDAKLEIQIEADAEKTLAGLQDRISKAIDGAKDFGQSGFDAALLFQDKLRDLGSQFEDGRINAKMLADEVARATAEYDKQIDGLKEADAIQKRLADAQKSRINELLKERESATQLDRDIATVLAEQLRLEQEIQARRQENAGAAADDAARQLAKIDQLLSSLQDQQQAFEQGFGDGFGRAFETTDKQVNDLINKAAEFGNAGANAALQFQEAVARVQQQARDGILNAEGYEQEIGRQRALFEQQLGVIKQEEQEKLAAAARVDAFLKGGINARRDAELAAAKELEERKKQAALNVAEIQKRIDAEERANQAARDKNNAREARETAARIRELRQLQRNERQIAEGTGRNVQQTLQRASSQQNNAFEQFASAATQQVQRFNNAISESVSATNNALAASAEGLSRIARQQRASLMLGPQQIATADVRTAEGQRMILDAAAQYQDPVLIQMRQQQKILQQISRGLTQNLSRIGMAAALV